MGCDIHCFVEKKNKKGEWEQIKGFESDDYQEGHEYFGSDKFKNADSPIDCRNYVLFGLLADVRNGSGFAGCDMGDGVEPISMPKGLPKDVSKKVKKESDEWGCDGHSHSWLTVNEIKNYNADKLPLEQNLKTVLSGFYKNTLPQLENISETGDDVRIVFWFDN